LLKGHKNYMIK